MSKNKKPFNGMIRVSSYTGRGADNYICEKYFEEASKFPLLKRDEEKKLATCVYKWMQNSRKAGMRTRQNGEKARQKLINSNLRLVIKIANEYRGMGLDFPDLINEGNMGLMKGVEIFNPNKGAKLSTYVSYWIKQCITRAVSNTSRTIRIPVHVGVLKKELNVYREQYLEENGEYPSNAEAAKFLKVSEPRVAEIMDSGNPMASLNMEIGDEADGSTEFLEILPDEQSISPSQQVEILNNRAVLDRVLNKLSKREKFIIIRRFGLHDYDFETLESIGDRYGVTRERIRQVEVIAMRKLRFYMAREMKEDI